MATLAHVRRAVAALEVPPAAQCGPGVVRWSAFFAVTRLPEWEPEQFTHGGFGRQTWQPVPYDVLATSSTQSSGRSQRAQPVSRSK